MGGSQTTSHGFNNDNDTGNITCISRMEQGCQKKTRSKIVKVKRQTTSSLQTAVGACQVEVESRIGGSYF